MRTSLFVLALLLAARGEAQTTIAPDSGAFDTSTQTAVSGNITTIGGGTLSGANLFHSFSQFDLARGDVAQWVRGAPDAASVAAIVNRVTGGNPSDIDGRLFVADMPNADFYFVNPAGIVFGEGAVVDVPGAAFFSTASELRFADGTAFSSRTQDGSTFSMAPPQAFGFIGGEQTIVFDRVGRNNSFLTREGALSVAASDIAISESGAAFSSPPGAGFTTAQLVLAATGGAAAEVLLTDGSNDALMGAILIADSSLTILPAAQSFVPRFLAQAGSVGIGDSEFILRTTDGSDAQGILLAADDIAIVRTSIDAGSFDAGDAGFVSIFGTGTVELIESFLFTDSLGTGEPGFILLQGRDVTLDATRMQLTNNSPADVGNAGGAVIIEAFEQLILRNNSTITVDAQSGGDAGDIVLLAGIGVTIADSELNSLTSGEGFGGTVNIAAPDVQIAGGRIVSTTTGSSDAGGVAIQANSISILDSLILTSAMFDFTNTDPLTGNAGNIMVMGGDEIVIAGSVLSSSADGEGDAGGVELSAIDIALETAIIDVGSFGTGDAGFLIVEAPGSLQLTNGSILFADAPGDGAAGLIFLDGGDILLDQSSLRVETFAQAAATQLEGAIVVAAAGDLIVRNGSSIFADTLGTANGGDVVLIGGNLQISDSQITSSARGTGNAGDIELRSAETLRVANSAIEVSTSGSGNAGAVVIEAANIRLVGQLLDDGTGELKPTTVISSEAEEFATGSAGGIVISATDSMATRRGVRLASSTQGPGDAGFIVIDVPVLRLGGTEITSSTSGAGRAGDILIFADNAIFGNGADPASTLITSEAQMGSTGDGGNILLVIDGPLEMRGNVSVTASSQSGGNAGRIGIAGGEMVLDQASIASQAFDSGNAGLVAVEADTLTLVSSRISSSAVGTGAAGTVTVDIAGQLELADGSSIESLSLGLGNGRTAGGLVQVSAAGIGIRGSQITGFTTSSDKGASVIVSADRIELDDVAFIDSEAYGDGSAGDVSVNATQSIGLADGSRISSLTDGPGDAGSVSVASPLLAVDNARITSASGDQDFPEASARGDAGSIFIDADRIDVINGGRISSDSIDGPAGNIVLAMPDDGRLRLVGEDPGVITTTSGPGTGGRITIASPYLILSNGGSILALGEQAGANVQISSQFYIRSADRINLLAVDGSLVLDSQISDLSAGTEVPDIAYLDASGVLSGQCAAARASGRTSRFTSRITGPYAPISPSEPDAVEPAETITLSSLTTTC